MKWFKHFTNANNDEVLSEMIETYGVESYGVWWIILETIGSQMDKTDKCFARYSVKKWAKTCGVSVKKFQKTVSFLSKFGKISTENCENSEKFLIISCPKLLKFRDEYTKKSGHSPDYIRRVSGVCPVQETETETETETDNKKTSKVFDDDSLEMKIAKYFYNVLLKSDPGLKKPKWQNWCKDIDLLIRVDNAKNEDIKKVINFAHDPANSKDGFSWIPNLRSPKKLRKHFKTILLQSKIPKKQSIEEHNEQFFRDIESDRAGNKNIVDIIGSDLSF